MPILPTGTYQLVVETSSRAGRHEDRWEVLLVGGLAVSLRLDRVHHRPGEPLRWAGLVRWRGSVHPAPGVEVRARIRWRAPAPARRERVVWEGRLQADPLGRVSGVFSETREPGDYTVELAVGDTRARAGAVFDARPRRPWRPFGPPAPALTVHALWHVAPGPGGAPARVLSLITLDGEGHLTPADLSVTFRAADRPAQAAAAAGAREAPAARAIRSPGIAQLPLPLGRLSYEVRARAPQGLMAEAKDWIPPWKDADLARAQRRRGLALPRVLVAPGEDLTVPCDPAPGAQLVSLMDGGASVAAAWCPPRAAAVTLRVPEGEWGLRTVRRVWVSRTPGRVDSAFAETHPARAKQARRRTREVRGAYVFVPPPAPLRLALDWAPGSGAAGRASTRVAVRVTDAQGAPVVGAAVRLRVVDAVVEEVAEQPAPLAQDAASERLGGPRGGRVWRGLFRQGAYGPRDLRAVEAVLRAADPPRPRVGQTIVPAHERWADEGVRLRRLYDRLVARATKRPGAVDALSPVEILRGGRAASAIAGARDPWGRPPTWAYLALRHPRLGPQRLAGDVTRRRLEAMEGRLRRRRRFWRRAFLGRRARPPEVVLARALRGAVWMVWDGWGTPIVARPAGGDLELRAAGPDRLLDTADDLVRRDVLADWGRGVSTSCSVPSWHHCTGGHGSYTVGHAVVRTGFDPDGLRLPGAYDATVVWAPSLVTDSDGRVTAAVAVPAGAPPATRWRVEAEAWAPTGATAHAVWHRPTAPTRR